MFHLLLYERNDFVFVSLLPPWFKFTIYNIIVRDEIFYDIVSYPWEPQYIICFLLTYADNNVCWVLYCYEIFYYMFIHVSHNIVFDYWCMLTIMSVEYYIAMKYFTIVPMRATILSDDYWRMLTIMSVEYNILLWNILPYCTHESHNIVCWLLTYSDNIVCWIIYCYEIYYYCTFMYATILSVTTERMLTIMSVEYYWAYGIAVLLAVCSAI